MGYDSSLNGNVSIGNDLIIGGRLSVRQYDTRNIINTTTTNYQLIVSEDLSLNGRMYVSGNVMIGRSGEPFYTLDVSSDSTQPFRVGVGTTNAIVVDNNGRVGIGITSGFTSQETMLIAANGSIIVPSTSWPSGWAGGLRTFDILCQSVYSVNTMRLGRTSNILNGIQCGYITTVENSHTITFSPAFQGTPIVFTQIVSSADDKMFVIHVNSVTRTGFQMKKRFFSSGNAAQAPAGAEPVYWMAIDREA